MSAEEINTHIEELKNEDISKYPSFFQMARNAIKQTWVSGTTVLAGQPFLVKAEVANARLEICNSCEYFEKEPGRCRKCGCFMVAKANLLKSGCPLNKWIGLTDVKMVDSAVKRTSETSTLKTTGVDIPPISEKFSSLNDAFNPYHHLAKQSSSVKLSDRYTKEEQEEFNRLYQAASLGSTDEERTFEFEGFTYNIRLDLNAKLDKKYNNTCYFFH